MSKPISWGMDQTEVMREQYAKDDKLRARIETHQRYTVGQDLEAAVDAALSLKGNESLLDVGTGPGDFPGRLRAGGHAGRLVGLDQSAGMLGAASGKHPGVEFVRGDVQALPFEDASFDVLTARHMLYHVPDIAAALLEFRRVLRPGGRFLAVTNISDNLRGLRDAMGEAARKIVYGVPDNELSLDLGRFSEREAPLVEETFGNTRTEFTDSALVFPDANSVLPYFESTAVFGRAPDQEDFRQAFLRVLRPHFADGPWRVPKRAVLISAKRY